MDSSPLASKSYAVFMAMLLEDFTWAPGEALFLAPLIFGEFLFRVF